MISMGNQFLIFLQGLLEGLYAVGEWLFTPLEAVSSILHVEVAPIAILGLAGITAIFIFHVAHLVNVIAG